MSEMSEMSEMKAKLQSEMIAAMKAGDARRRDTLRGALAAVTEAETAGAARVELSDDDIVKLLTREAKRCADVADVYAAAGEPERAAAERADAAVLSEFLPAQLSEDDLVSLVAAVVAELGASSMKDMGAVMREVNARAAGAADGRRVSTAVKVALNG